MFLSRYIWKFILLANILLISNCFAFEKEIIEDGSIEKLDNLLIENRLSNDQIICTVVSLGRIDILKKFQLKNIDINPNQSCDNRGRLIHIAVENQYEEIVKFLIELNVDINLPRKYSSDPTAFDLALTTGNISITKMLMEQVPIISNDTLIYAAMNEENLSILKELVKKGYRNDKAIEKAYINSAYENFKFLIETFGIPKKSLNATIITAPHNAERYINLLLDKGIDINDLNKIILIDSFSRQNSILKWLVDKGINSAEILKFCDGDIAEYILSNRYVANKYVEQYFDQLKFDDIIWIIRDSKKINLLLKNVLRNKKLRFKYKDKLEWIYIVAARDLNYDIVKLLVDNDININAYYIKHYSEHEIVKFYPISYHNLDDSAISIKMMQLLLEHGLNPNMLDINGNNLLHLLRKDKICQLLIKYKININQKNNAGYSPLLKAIPNASIEYIKLLLKAGAKIEKQEIIQVIDFNRSDIMGLFLETLQSSLLFEEILVLTTSAGSYTMSKMALEKGAKIDIQTTFGKKIIFNAVINYMPFIYENLRVESWEQIIYEEGNLLHISVLSKNLDALNFFLSYISANKLNDKGETPLHFLLKQWNKDTFTKNDLAILDILLQNTNNIDKESVKIIDDYELKNIINKKGY